MKSNFKFDIGNIIKDDSRNLKIIDRKRKRANDGNLYKYYKYKCLNCGWDCGFHYNHKLNCFHEEFWVLESNLLKENGSGCACCNNKVVIKNVNNLVFKYPNIEKYLVDKQDGYIHTPQSHKKVLCQCPICHTKKYYNVDRLVKQGFSCNKCSDKISYPEKLLANILYQLNVQYIKQYCLKNSTRKYLYDFYFVINNEPFIIEVNGIQHYVETKFNYKNTRTLNDEIKNDIEKKHYAINSGIKEENYIIIDARKSDLEYIKNNIIKSRLKDIFNLQKVDWNECGIYATKNLLLDICLYWNKYSNIMTTSAIAKKYQLHKNTIIRYLKTGCQLGLCNYNSNLEREKQYNRQKQQNLRGKPVEIFKNGISYGNFISSAELSRKSKEIFGVELDKRNISAVCTGKQKSHKGFTFKFI